MRITPELKQKIKLYMLEHELTQKAFAALFKVTHPSVNKWLNKPGSTLTEEHARKLCEVLGLDYAAEMYAQNLADGKTVNVQGDNSGVAIQNNGCTQKGYTFAEIAKAITNSDLSNEEKLAVISALSKIGLF